MVDQSFKKISDFFINRLIEKMRAFIKQIIIYSTNVLKILLWNSEKKTPKNFKIRLWTQKKSLNFVNSWLDFYFYYNFEIFEKNCVDFHIWPWKITSSDEYINLLIFYYRFKIIHVQGNRFSVLNIIFSLNKNNYKCFCWTKLLIEIGYKWQNLKKKLP